jgi:hypothetical protein
VGETSPNGPTGVLPLSGKGEAYEGRVNDKARLCTIQIGLAKIPESDSREQCQEPWFLWLINVTVMYG